MLFLLNGGTGGHGGAGAGPSAAYTNFAARCTTAGHSLTGSEINRYQTLLDNLTADGFFDVSGNSSLLDALYIFAAPTSSVALLNLVKNASNPSEQGTITFTANTGYAGNGTNGYLDTGFSPGTGSPKFIQDSASMGVYVLTNRAASVKVEMGGGETSGPPATRSEINPFFTGTTGDAELNGNTFAQYTNTASQGMYVLRRVGSTQFFVRKNETALATLTSTSLAPVDRNFLYGAWNITAGPSNFSNDQLSAGFIGAGLTAPQADSIANRINAFMTALGINVY